MRVLFGKKVRNDLPAPIHKRGHHERGGKWKELLNAMRPKESTWLTAGECANIRTCSRKIEIQIVTKKEGKGYRIWKI